MDNNTDEILETEETTEEVVENINNTEDEFHERDSLAENNIVKEVQDSFLDYAVSVITSRALPDLRDGLKPVHRRILWSIIFSC